MRKSATYVAVIAICAAILAGLAVLSTPALADTSSRGNSRGGTLALYDWYTRLGYATHRFEGTFDLAGSDVIVLDNPTSDLTAGEAETLREFAQQGGHVVVATGSTFLISPLLHLLGVGVAGVTSDQVATAAPGLSGAQVNEVDIFGGARLIQAPAEATPLLVANEGYVGVAVPVGSGRITIITSGVPLDNDGLRRSDDARLALYLAEQARGGRIGFDDFHHQTVTQDPQAVIFRSPLGLGLLLAVLAILAALISNGRQLGRPVPRHDPGRVPSAADYVHSMSQLFTRSSDRGSVAGRYAEEFKARVAGATGVHPQLSDDEFTAAVTAFDPAHGAAAGELLAKARVLAVSRPDDTALVALAREIDGAEGVFSGRAPAE